jgi:hypothetical protein
LLVVAAAVDLEVQVLVAVELEAIVLLVMDLLVFKHVVQ